MKIPSQNNWTQTNKGDILGVLHETENVTLDTKGKIKLSRKAFTRLTSDDYANLKGTLGIVFYDSQYIALTTTSAFKFDLGGSTTTEITLSADVGMNSDIMVAYNRAYITTNDNLDYYDGSLTQSVYALTASVPHPMALFDSKDTYKLCIGNGNSVVILSSSHVAGTALTLPQQYQVTTMAVRNGYLYVGTKNTSGGEAKIFLWDGNGAAYNYEVPVGASQVYSIIPYMSTVALVTNMGRLLTVSGNQTSELAVFPVYNNPNAVWDNTVYLSYPSKVLHRGMVAIDNKIYIHIDGTVDSGYMPEMKHGLWVFDPECGLYHRSYGSTDRSVVETPSALSDNTLTLSTHYLKDGDLLIIRTLGSLTGLVTATRYYVKVISPTQVKLALSRKALKAGNYMTIGGAVTSSDISYVPNTEYGQYQNSFAGGITAINPEEPFFTGWETPVIWGNRLQNLDGDEFYSISSFTDAWNIGRFTTQRIYSDNIKQNWQKVFCFLSGLLLDNEQIVIKAKTNAAFKNTGVFTGAWLNANTINSTDGFSAQQWTDIELGDEVTVLDGYGRGYTVHVVSADLVGSTYTVVVDENIGTANKPVRFSVDTFKKIGTIDNTKMSNSYFEQSLLGLNSSLVILKFELRGFEIEIDMLDLMNQVNKVGG